MAILDIKPIGHLVKGGGKVLFFEDHRMAHATMYQLSKDGGTSSMEPVFGLDDVQEIADDASRYRWLRDKAPEEWDITRWLDGEIQEIHVQDYLDAAIDAAMQATSAEVGS